MSQNFNHLPTRITETAEKIFVAFCAGATGTMTEDQIAAAANAALKTSEIFHAEMDKFEAPYREQVQKNFAEHVNRMIQATTPLKP